MTPSAGSMAILCSSTQADAADILAGCLFHGSHTHTKWNDGYVPSLQSIRLIKYMLMFSASFRLDIHPRPHVLFALTSSSHRAGCFVLHQTYPCPSPQTAPYLAVDTRHASPTSPQRTLSRACLADECRKHSGTHPHSTLSLPTQGS